MVKNLKKLREEHGLSQQRLAELVGLTQQALFKYEKTSVEPDIKTLIALADILHTSVDILIGHESPETAESGTAESRIMLTGEELRCIKQLRRLTPQVRENLLRLTESLDPKPGL